VAEEEGGGEIRLYGLVLFLRVNSQSRAIQTPARGDADLLF